MKRTITVVLLAILFNFCLSTLSPPSDKKTQKNIKPQEGARKTNVQDRKLVIENAYVKDILKYHATYHQDVSFRNFKNPVLGYVTPVSSLIFTCKYFYLFLAVVRDLYYYLINCCILK